MWSQRGLVRTSVSLCALLAASPALAQRTDDNATASAQDAFGTSVGDSNIGVYGETDVRGFSPADAGNLRIEGLYYDQQGSLTGRLQEGSNIRVGISAQSYPFPAPTGIADYALRKPGAEAIASLALTYGPRGARFAEADFKLPLDGERLGVAGGIGADRDRRPYGGTPDNFSAGLLLRWAPAPDSELLAFAVHYRNSNNEAQPLIFTSGAFLPRRFRRGRFLGQDWNDFSATAPTYGLMARGRIGGFDLAAGAFRSGFDNDVSTADLLFGTDRDNRVAQRLIVRERDDRYVSNSGELRVSRAIQEGPRQHVLIGSLRARDVTRLYGGGAIVDLGASRADAEDLRPEPVTEDGAKSRDRIRQWTLGLAYQGKWLQVGEIGLSLQRTFYRKRITDPDPAVLLPETRSSPWLPTATAAIYLTGRLALYGGYTRGLEESAVAPVEAVNLNDAPPAIRTEQMDGGLRWTISPGLTAVAGLFRVAKPYFNLDPARRFRQLGAVTNRGVELSVAGQIAPGLSLVAGTILLDARISGEEVDRGSIGSRPVGTFVRRTIVSVDYRLPWYNRVSVDAVLDSSSSRVANTANTLFVRPRATLALGARYRFSIGETPLLVRAQVQNVTNTFGWNVGRSGFFTPNAARSYSISLAADL